MKFIENYKTSIVYPHTRLQSTQMELHVAHDPVTSRITHTYTRSRSGKLEHTRELMSAQSPYVTYRDCGDILRLHMLWFLLTQR